MNEYCTTIEIEKYSSYLTLFANFYETPWLIMNLNLCIQKLFSHEEEHTIEICLSMIILYDIICLCHICHVIFYEIRNDQMCSRHPGHRGTTAQPWLEHWSVAM